MSSAVEQFDPYSEWLDIPPHETAAGAPDHYRLLAVARFETDVARIAAAADERMAKVRTFQVGPRGRFTQRLLNELAAAKVCLLSPAAKREYDDALAQAMSAALARQRQAPIVVPPPLSGHAQHQLLSDESPCLPETPDAAPWWRIVLSISAAALVVLVAVLALTVMGRAWNSSPRPAAGTSPLKPVTVDEWPALDEPTLQEQEGSGEVTLTAATAKTLGGVELRHSGAEPVLANWSAPDSQALWRLRMIQPGFFNVELVYATSAEALGTSLKISVGQNSKTIELRATGGLDQFQNDTFTIAVPTSGQHTFAVRPIEPLGGDWLAIRSVRLIPVGGTTPPPILPEPDQ